MLGTVDRGRVFQLAIALAEANAADSLALVAQMAEHAVDFNNLLADLINLIHRIAIAQAVPDAVDNSQGDKEQVMALAQAMSPSMIQLMYQVALTGKRDLPIAPDPRAGMEMTLLRMLNFAPIGQQAEANSPQTGIGAPPAKKPDLAHLKRQIVNSVVESSQSTSMPETSVEQNVLASPPPSQDLMGQSMPDKAVDSSLADSLSDDTQQAENTDFDEPPFDIHAPDYQVDDALVIIDHSATVVTETVEPVITTASEGISSRISEKQDVPEEVSQLSGSISSKIEGSSLIPTVEQVKEVEIADKEIQVPENLKASPSEVSGEPEPAIIDMTLSQASWPLIFEYLPVEGMLRNLIANSCLIQINGNELLFHGDSGHMRLFSATHQQRFNEILNEVLKTNYVLQVIDGPLMHETPAQRAQRLTAEKLQIAIESIENDVNVHAIRQAFDAQVIMESITPLH